MARNPNLTQAPSRRNPAAETTLAGLVRAHCPHDGRFDLQGIAGLHLSRYSKVSTELNHVTARPVLCIVAQGEKAIILGSEVLHYDSSRMLVISVDLPVTGQVVRATPSEPYLSLIIDLAPQRIAELLLRIYPDGMPRATNNTNSGADSRSAAASMSVNRIRTS